MLSSTTMSRQSARARIVAYDGGFQSINVRECESIERVLPATQCSSTPCTSRGEPATERHAGSDITAAAAGTTRPNPPADTHLFAAMIFAIAVNTKRHGSLRLCLSPQLSTPLRTYASSPHTRPSATRPSSDWYPTSHPAATRAARSSNSRRYAHTQPSHTGTCVSTGCTWCRART